MPVWRNARLRRLYGKPEDPIEAPPVGVTGSRTRNGSRGDVGGKSAEPAATHSPTPPPPKRVKREKTRPESEYELVHNMPATQTLPDYSLLTNPITEEQANVVAYAIHSSRQNWLSGAMFETFWTRKPRGKKIADGQVNLREKMTKLHECSVTLGPHTFPVRLFTVRDDNVHLDDEADKRIEEQLAKEKLEKAQAEAKLNPRTSETPANGNDTKPEPHSEEDTPIETARSDKVAQQESSNDKDENSNETVNDDTTTQDMKAQEPAAEAAENPEGRTVDVKSSEESVKGEPSEQTTEDKSTEKPTVEKPSERAELPLASSEPEEKRKSPKKNAKRGRKSKNAEEQSKSDEKEPSVAQDNEPVGASEAAVLDSKPDSNNASEKARHELSAADAQTFQTERESLQAEKLRNAELEKKLSHNGTPTDATVEKQDDNVEKQEGAESTPLGDSTNNGANVDTRETNGAASVPQQASQTPLQPAPPSQQPMTAQPNFVPQPQTNPSQLVVYRLQQMAARDPSLSELMKHVASGTAPPDSIAKFQEVINRVKASIFAPPPPSHIQRKAPKNKQQNFAPPKQPIQRVAPIYHTRANAKAVMLAIEFEESPTDRYLLPKRSITEYIPDKEEMLWSFLHVHEPQSRNEKKKFTPVTAVFHGIPFRIAQTLERCVRKPEVVAVYMKEDMAEAERAEPWHIWFQIEKNDEVLLDLIKKMPIPHMPPPAPPKKPTKPRKPRGLTPAQLEQQKNHETMEQLRIIKRGQPLPVRPFFQTVIGQPPIQIPSTWQPLMIRRTLPYQFQAQPSHMQYGQPMPLSMPTFRPQFPPPGVPLPSMPAPPPSMQQSNLLESSAEVKQEEDPSNMDVDE